MKREYFTFIFLALTVVSILIAKYFISYDLLKENVLRFMVIWVLVAFLVGQYSMRFQKAF